MKLWLSFLVLTLSLSVAGQEDFIPQKPTHHFIDYQEQYERWYQSSEKEKHGYKWYKRWLNLMETRTGPYGKTAPATGYLKAAAQMAAQKDYGFGSRASDTNWVPEGPDTLTGAYNSTSSHGVARVNTITFHPTDTNTYWVGVSQGGIWKTTNRGKTYFPVNNGLPILRISDIAIDKNHPDTLYASVCDYAYIGVALSTDGRKRNTHYGVGLYKSYNGGLTWEPTGLTFEQDEYDNSLIRRTFVNPANSQELICAGVEGIFKSTDGGDSWTKKHNGLIWDFEQNPLNPNTIYASSGHLYNLGIGEPKLLVSHNFGDSWQSIGTGHFNSNEAMSRVEITISSADTNYVYAVACGKDRGLYGFYKSTNAGQSFVQTIDSSSGPNILDWQDGSQVGGQGTYDLTIYVDKNDRDRVYVGGINIWGSTDGGVTWNGCSYWLRYYGFTPHADQHFLTHNPLDNMYYLCNDGGIFRTDSIKMGSWAAANNNQNYEFPTVWEDVSSGMQITSLYRIGLCDSVPGYIVSGAQDNGTFYRDNSGHWMNITGGDGMDAEIQRDNPSKGMSSSQYGYFYTFSNYGATTRRLFANNLGSGAWTTPIEQSSEKPGEYYIGTDNVYYLENPSRAYSLGTVNPGRQQSISAFAVSQREEMNLIVAKRPDFIDNIPTEVYYTFDRGSNWLDITSGLPDSLFCTDVAIDDKDPLIIWATFGGFAEGQKVFRSNDGGNSWINISRNLPDIAINTIVQDEQTNHNAIYVGCDVGVFYTNDSLNEWKPVVSSLPNVIISDLEIHKKERRLYASTFGRGIWSVGVQDTVYIFPEDTASTDPNVQIAEYFNDAKFSLFPNPNQGEFSLEASAADGFEAEIQIISVTGRTVFQESTQIDRGYQIKKYKLALEDGIYFLRVNGQGKSKVQRFLVTQ